MQSIVSFQNAGLIDPRCITTIGVSVKETENPIGFFGTGLKYAIAIILRNGGEITIWRGLEALRFDSVAVPVRGQTVQVVRMNGVELGFTTDLGKHWEIWQAMREIYCNAKDEGGRAVAELLPPVDDSTTITVHLDAFADCFRRLHEYILQGEPVVRTPSANFHIGKGSRSVFYRSVRVGEVQKPFEFVPDCIGLVTLTEDRTMRNVWEAICTSEGGMSIHDISPTTRRRSAPANVGEIDRRTYLGGSDIAAVLGLDAYNKTPLTVYMAKIGERAGIMDPEKKKFLERRKRWEGPIVQMLREEFDGEIVGINNRYVDEEHPFMAAEIDFEWVNKEDGTIQNGEIKTVSPFAFGERSGWGEAGSDEIPIHYHAQVMHGLGVTGRDTTIVCAMVGLDTMVFYRVDRDEEAIAAMRAAAVKFWNDHVEKKIPPGPISMLDVMILHRRTNGRPVDLDDETAAAVHNLRIARMEADSLKGSMAELELQIAKFICEAWNVATPEEVPDNAALLHQGKKLCTWAAGRGAHLDQQRLAKEYPEIKAQLTVPHYYRTFRFPKTT
jgi:hypothetical protein